VNSIRAVVGNGSGFGSQVLVLGLGVSYRRRLGNTVKVGIRTALAGDDLEDESVNHAGSPIGGRDDLRTWSDLCIACSG
jgi:hypothetical protein